LYGTENTYNFTGPLRLAKLHSMWTRWRTRMRKKETKQTYGLCCTDSDRLTLVDTVLCLLSFLPLPASSNAMTTEAAIFSETSVNF